MITVKSTINIAGQTVPQIIPVVQGDTGRSILFTLADFTIPQGSTATYYVQKPSGEAVYNVATIDGNTVLVELTAQSIIEHGDNYGQVRIENDGEIVTSFDFILLVKPFRGIDAVESTTEMNIFDKAVEQAEEAIDEAKVAALEEIAEAGSGNIAEEFDAANSYLAGEYTIYNAKLYRFTSNHTGAWSGSDAEEVTVGDELTDVKDGLTALNEDFIKATTKDKSQLALTTWSASRVKSEDGTLTYSPSQKTTDKILYVGKGSIIKVAVNSTGTSLSISYYQFVDGVLAYVRSDVVAIRKLKYVCCAYDYCRISLIGTSQNPPVVTDYTIDILYPVENEFYGKKIAFLGDSITTFQNTSETSSSYNSPYYPTSDVEYLEQTYEKMFFDACGGGNIAVSAISNSSWRNQGIASCPSAYDDTRIARLATNGNPDYVFINMGTNDPYSSNIGDAIGYTYDVDTLAANVVYSSYAIQTTIRKIQVAYPNAKIIILIPKFASAIGSGNYTFEKWEKLINYIYQIGNMYGVYKIIDLRKCGISVETFSTDCISSGMHPNFTGMKKMGAYLIDQLLLS